MKRSDNRIITTHVGSLPRPTELIPLLQAKDSGRPYDEAELERRVPQSVQAVVRKQAEPRGLRECRFCHRLTYLVDLGLVESRNGLERTMSSVNGVLCFLLRDRILVTHKNSVACGRRRWHVSHCLPPPLKVLLCLRLVSLEGRCCTGRGSRT